MSKAKSALKTEFSGLTSLDIFIKCLINGSVKLQGKSYSITSIAEALDADHYVVDWMRENTAFYNFDFAKYDAHFYNVVVDKVLSKDNDWINNNFVDVLVCFFKTSFNTIFNLTSEDGTKSVSMYINAVEFFHAITNSIANEKKSILVDVLGDDEYSESVSYVNNYNIELLFSLTKGDFLNKSYKKEFIKTFMSLAGARQNGTGVKKLDSISECVNNSKSWNNAYFDYKDETLFFKIRDEKIGICFANDKIEFIFNGDLSVLAKAILTGNASYNFVTELFNK